MKIHNYTVRISWTGNTGLGTSNYEAYERSYDISAEKKITIQGSSDPAFLGDGSKYNPEELLLASISSCHMLWFLHLCAEQNVIVTTYEDKATAIMTETPAGGKFEEVTLFPVVEVTEASMISTANNLHTEANRKCYIANSLNFKVYHQPQCTVKNN